MVAHLSAFVFPAIIVFYAVSEISLFSLHPSLMSIGCSLLMFEGILIFSKNSSLFPSMARTTKASIHYWLAGIGVLCVFTGSSAIYFHKNSQGKAHYSTWHGTLGALTTTYILAQTVGGVVLKYHKSLANFIKVKLVDLKLYHATSGLLAFVLVTVTLLLALQSNWVSHHIPWYLWYICMACVSASALVVSTHITSTYLPQARKKPSSR